MKLVHSILLYELGLQTNKQSKPLGERWSSPPTDICDTRGATCLFIVSLDTYDSAGSSYVYPSGFCIGRHKTYHKYRLNKKWCFIQICFIDTRKLILGQLRNMNDADHKQHLNALDRLYYN